MSNAKNDSEHLLTKEKLDGVRSIEGFPIGKDEDIIALSNPPQYTACPNPWITGFIKEHRKPYNPTTDSYNREPFATDVSEGKNDPIYNAHAYHTKVPHKAIMRYILHYTDPGDLVYDGFCGTGMTGVAAQICANPQSAFKEQIENELPGIKWGVRNAILNDLSPGATFIAKNYNSSVDIELFEKEARRILKEVEDECGWMYRTQHIVDGKNQFTQNVDGNKTPIYGRINFTAWSDVFLCPSCAGEIVYWDVAVDHVAGDVREEFSCPHCNALLKKRSLDRAWELVFDETLNTTIKRAKQLPVLINYSIKDNKGKTKRIEKKPDSEDIAIIKQIENKKIPYWYPTNRMPEGDESRRNDETGITHIHHFFTKRNLWVLSVFRKKLFESTQDKLPFWFSSTLPWCGRENRLHLGNYFGKTGGVITSLRGTLYLASLQIETNVIERFGLRLKSSQFEMDYVPGSVCTFTQSSTDLTQIPTNCVDYIFVDPPFGANLMYSELNFILEGWIRVFTNNKTEAVVNNSQRKGLLEYQHLMEQCFKEFYRILKPGRWMTVEFHNSQNSVWMSIQEGLMRAGFVVADVRTLDKKKGSFKQVNSTSAVKQDLIISAYKPNGGLEERFKLTAGKPDAVWDFVRQHLKHLPVISEKSGSLQIIADRQPYLLFDRMVAFHVQRGVIVPISAGDFYAGLRQRLPERDGMYFLEDQVSEYDRKRMSIKQVEQDSLLVCDEKSSVHWLRRELSETPDTLQNLRPRFMKELHQYKHEKLPELSEILKENFLEDSDGKWYVPDPAKEVDLIKVREKGLIREFDEYKKSKGKLKFFRTEAVRSGFKKCWSDKDYTTIIEIGQRLPSTILQEDDVLLMYYDNALTRQGIIE
jgi:DNA modification methylase